MNFNPGTYHCCDDMRARLSIGAGFRALELFGVDYDGNKTALTFFMDRGDKLEALAGAINAVQAENELSLLESLAKSLAGRAETSLLGGAILRAIGQHGAEAMMTDRAISTLAAE